MSKEEVKNPKWTESIEKSLLSILKDIEDEDIYIRQRMLRECKQNELYWHGFQYIFWDERVQDFRIPTQDVMDQVSSREEVKFIYDYVVNIFKAHGLSIIAALSAEVPGVPISPMDADNPKDNLAAKKAEALGKVIQKYNNSKLLFYHALFILFTNHFVASYNYYERDKKFGQVDVPKFETVNQPDSYDCENGDCEYSSETNTGSCPECGGSLKEVPGGPQLTQTGTDTIDKGMEKIVVKGTLNIKISTWAGDQEGCGYLIDYSDQHYAWLRKEYKDVDRNSISPSSSDNFERIARMPSIGRLYSDTYLQSLLTLKRVWVRDWMYDSLDEEQAEELRTAYPKGCYFAVIESSKQILVEVREEELDAHWTIAKGDLSRAVHGDPLCKPLLPMQDLENTLMNLMVESIEHSIPTTWADPEIVDFETYSKQEVSPGSIYPGKNSIGSNRRMEDYFFKMQTATLPEESITFGQVVDSKAQFLVGAFPSIFGGPQTEGSKTLGEYQESRGYALQRLSIPYQMLFFWWAHTIYKSITDYISNMITDEKHSIQSVDGKFDNIHLLMEDFAVGRFNTLLVESATDLPVSFSQKRSNIQNLFQLNNDNVNQFLLSPENRKTTLKFLGLEELTDLDTNQTMKQLVEIEQLAMGQPTVSPQQDPITSLPMEMSSVPIEPEVDDSEIHLRVIKTYCSSEIGQALKRQNLAGYKNILLHAREHQQALMQQMMQEAQRGKPEQSEGVQQ